MSKNLLKIKSVKNHRYVTWKTCVRLWQYITNLCLKYELLLKNKLNNTERKIYVINIFWKSYMWWNKVQEILEP
jgi:hypothetical protein